MASRLREHEEDYLNGMAIETQNYVDNVLRFCADHQQGASNQSVTYNQSEVEYLIDLLSYTYDKNEIDVDWDNLKENVIETFFSGGTTITLRDDIKALIYFISTYHVDLAPEWPVDIQN